MFFFYLVTWRHLLSGASLGFFGYAFGGSLALLAKMEKPQVSLGNCQNAQSLNQSFKIIAVAIETAIQNGGIVERLMEPF